MGEATVSIERRHIATEQRTLEEIVQDLSHNRQWLETVISRLKGVAVIPDHARVLEIGSAAGGNLVSLKQLGYDAVGLEPSDEARRNARELAEHLGVSFDIIDGGAEEIPLESGGFDMVLAFSVIEHVLDVEKVFGEISRVLKPGGLFWFNTASSMSPMQGEIRGFPLFGWYPDSLKRKIMYWAKDAKPHLIGHTTTPAIHWFTPRKARTLLQRYGFNKVYDRWDIRGQNEAGTLQRITLQVVRSTKLSKTIADIIMPGCSYCAIKG
jgi:SAM-dependent methyltransferase